MKLMISLFLGVFFALFLPYASVAKGADTEPVAEMYAQKAHTAFEEDNFPQAGELYEKAYGLSPLPVYLENAITAYLHKAFDLLQEKNYEEAIKFCEKTLTLSPKHNEAMEILSDIYCSRGSNYYFRGRTDMARVDLEKALEYSQLPDQREKAQELLMEIGGDNNRNYD